MERWYNVNLLSYCQFNFPLKQLFITKFVILFGEFRKNIHPCLKSGYPFYLWRSVLKPGQPILFLETSLLYVFVPTHMCHVYASCATPDFSIINHGHFSFLGQRIFFHHSFQVSCLFIKDNNNKLSTFQTGKIHENFQYLFNEIRGQFQNFPPRRRGPGRGLGGLYSIQCPRMGGKKTISLKLFFSPTRAPAGPPKICFTRSLSREARR